MRTLISNFRFHLVEVTVFGVEAHLSSACGREKFNARQSIVKCEFRVGRRGLTGASCVRMSEVISAWPGRD